MCNSDCRVPSDIQISQALEPIHISKIAEDAGIQEDELDLYGPHKAKVHLAVRDRLGDVKNGATCRPNRDLCAGA